MYANSSAPEPLLLQQHWAISDLSGAFCCGCLLGNCYTHKTGICERKEKIQGNISRQAQSCSGGMMEGLFLFLMHSGLCEEQQHQDNCTQSGNVSHQRSTDWRFEIVVFSCSQSVTQQAIGDDGSHCCFCRKMLQHVPGFCVWNILLLKLAVWSQ